MAFRRRGFRGRRRRYGGRPRGKRSRRRRRSVNSYRILRGGIRL